MPAVPSFHLRPSHFLKNLLMIFLFLSIIPKYFPHIITSSWYIINKWFIQYATAPCETGVRTNLIQQSVVNSLLRYWWGLLTGVLTGRIRLVPGKGPNRIRISIVPQCPTSCPVRISWITGLRAPTNISRGSNERVRGRGPNSWIAPLVAPDWECASIFVIPLTGWLITIYRVSTVGTHSK